MIVFILLWFFHYGFKHLHIILNSEMLSHLMLSQFSQDTKFMFMSDTFMFEKPYRSNHSHHSKQSILHFPKFMLLLRNFKSYFSFVPLENWLFISIDSLAFISCCLDGLPSELLACMFFHGSIWLLPILHLQYNSHHLLDAYSVATIVPNVFLHC